ncbi:MAG: manganese efflux pump [Clostridium sp.]|nr:manganese efflux pump [Clostridium sp.]
MSLTELFILAVGVSMDAFAVSVCKGLSIQRLNWRHAVLVGLYFGGFQAAMPLMGYLLGARFKDSIASFDHWIAFILLAAIGFSMIREACSKEEEELDGSLGFKTMSILALATSIDALAVGVTLSFLNVEIVPAVSFIGIITFLLSAAGVRIGHVFGTRYKSKAELGGGAILILIGLKILIEHLFF